MLGVTQSKIQKGFTAITGPGSLVHTPIKAVRNVDACVVLVSSADGFAAGHLINSTTICCSCSAAGVVHWQVIEFGGAVIE